MADKKTVQADQVDESQFEMVSAGTKFGPKPTLRRQWVGVPEIELANGKKAAFYASQVTGGDYGRFLAERRQYDSENRLTGIDDTRDAMRRLAWGLRDGQGRRCWPDTDTALADIEDWPDDVIDRLLAVLNDLRETPAADDADAEKNSGETQTG